MRSLVLALLLAGCAASGYGLSVATSPETYLETFPIGMSKEQLANEVGIPDSTATVDGREVWSYTIGTGYGKRMYSFELDEGAVYDVRYNDQGPLNGSSARAMQATTR